MVAGLEVSGGDLALDQVELWHSRLDVLLVRVGVHVVRRDAPDRRADQSGTAGCVAARLVRRRCEGAAGLRPGGGRTATGTGLRLRWGASHQPMVRLPISGEIRGLLAALGLLISPSAHVRDVRDPQLVRARRRPP
jgi:hypothetical protein